MIIGGAPKSGTSALYRYFEQHPQICLAKKKELHFFSKEWLEVNCAGKGDKYVLAEVPKTFDDYLSYFSECKKEPVIADISPSYLHHYKSAHQIKDLLGTSVRFVFLLRNPADKAYSQYMHLVGVGRETLNFENALKIEKERIIQGYSDMWLYKNSSLYAKPIQTFIDVFGTNNVKVILYDDFRSNQDQCLKEICSFAGIDDAFKFQAAEGINRSGKPKSSLVSKLIAPNSFTFVMRRLIPQRLGRFLRNFIKNLNTGAKPEIPVELKTQLLMECKEDIQKLETILNKKTGWLD